MSRARAERMLARVEALSAARCALGAADAALAGYLAGVATPDACGRAIVLRILDRIHEGRVAASAELVDLRAALLEEVGMGADHE